MKKARLKSFLTDYRTLLGLWILLGVLATVMKYHSDIALCRLSAGVFRRQPLRTFLLGSYRPLCRRSRMARTAALVRRPVAVPLCRRAS